MPFLAFFSLALVAPSFAHATVYYVDATTGSDSNSGTSVTAPWKTVAKVNSKTYAAGDSILFNRGRLWREQLTVSSSGAPGNPITYGAYGTGAKPIISGADVVTGWTPYSGNIYVANVTRSSAPTQLYVDGVFYDLAHYPKSGYLLTTAKATNATSLIAGNLTLSASQIVGATVSTRAVRWHISNNTATAYDATSHTITLNGPTYSSGAIMGAGSGFYLSNMLWMLDSPGEWFFDPSAGKLYLWTATGDSPANHTVEISNRTYGVVSSGKHDVTIQDLAIANADQKDLYLYLGANLTGQRLDLSGGLIGILFVNTTNGQLNQNAVRSPLGSGIYVVQDPGYTNNFISGNIISNAGTVGGTPKQSNAGIFADGSGITIQNNSVSNSGYNGIEFHGNQNTVKGNAVDQSCMVLDDGGGIYTVPYGYTNTTSSIVGNAVTNVIGNSSGTPDPHTHGHGIYLDDNSHDTTVSGNTVSNADLGIYLHRGYNNTVTDNSVYGARSYGFYLEEDSGSAGSVYNNLVSGNAWETSAAAATVGYNSAVESSTNFGAYNNNMFCHPNSDYVVNNQNVNYNLLGWQQKSGQDLNSLDQKALCSAASPTLTLGASSPVNGSSVLTWSSSNATSCTAGGAWSGAVPLSSSLSVTDSGTYDLTCTGRGGSATQSVTVNTGSYPTAPQPPTVSVSASPASVAYNGSSTLSWSSTNATSCSASGAWSGSQPVSGSQTLSNLTTGGTYTLSCTGSGGTASASTSVAVAAAPPAPTVTLSASPSTVKYRGSSKLSWSSTNATSCVASGAWSGTKAVSGSQYLSRLSRTATYTLSCTGSGGTASRSQTITVTR